MQINLEDIVIPKHMQKTKPSEKKLEKKRKAILEGTNTSVIKLTRHKNLTDGYTTYLIYKEMGIQSINVEASSYVEVKRQTKREEVFNRCKGKCSFCHRKLHNDVNGDKESYMTIDHILPKSLGGTNEISNLQGLCKRCNEEKGNNVNKRDQTKLDKIKKKKKVKNNESSSNKGSL